MGTITTDDISKAHEALLAETKSKEEARTDLRAAMITYYSSPDGLREIGNAPQWLQEKTVEEIVDLLLTNIPK